MSVYFLLNTVVVILHLQLQKIKLQIEDFLVLLQVTLNSSVRSFFFVSVVLVLIRVNSVLLILLKFYIELDILLFYSYVQNRKPLYSQHVYYAEIQGPPKETVYTL
jgi:hypothetical protein